MTTQKLAEEAFRDLLAEGKQVLDHCGWDGDQYQRHPPENDFIRFRTNAINLIRRVCGDTSEHYRELKRLSEAKESASVPYFFIHCYGVAEAAYKDLSRGLLFDMKALIEAEVLGDFLEQAESLFSAGYQVPAASLCGAVLEDTLRALCERNGITIPTKTKIDALNSDLLRAGIYGKLTQKRITALADIRNNADHGHFDKFKHDDVEDMLKWVRNFAADHLK